MKLFNGVNGVPIYYFCDCDSVILCPMVAFVNREVEELVYCCYLEVLPRYKLIYSRGIYTTM